MRFNKKWPRKCYLKVNQSSGRYTRERASATMLPQGKRMDLLNQKFCVFQNAYGNTKQNREKKKEVQKRAAMGRKAS